MYKKILVPLDGSPQSEEALPLALTLAKENNAKVVVSRVPEISYTLYAECYGYPHYDPDFEDTVRVEKKNLHREIENYLEQIASRLSEQGLKISIEVCEGPVVDAILASIDRLDIDLVVLTTCGQSGGGQWMMGAVADRILHDARVPVILIRPTSCSPF